MLTDVPQLTAVSGVITLPSVDPTPVSSPGSEKPHPSLQQTTVGAASETVEEHSQSGATSTEDAEVAAAKKAEREKRREEMRLRNEQRRKEREEKRKQMIAEREERERGEFIPSLQCKDL